uniref:Neur_chan_LBD domain-containing protein n=1 Tax=Parastrongyloides trichosuri TaxID=131310 RepID=A0A0N4ZMR7_PARTI
MDIINLPIQNESEPIHVSLGISFQQILDIDEKSQFMTSNIWFKMSWHDMYLTWDPTEYAGISELRLPIETLWRPDLMLYNNVDHNLDALWPVNAVVKHDGNVTWIPPAIIKSTCRIEIRWFPFDQQNCTIKIGSWTYSGYFTELNNASISLDTYTPNGEWLLISLYSQRNVFRYDCCDEPYYDVTFYVIIRRRTLYYSFNLVLPSLLISILALLGFTLPPDSGEKLNLCVTIFMSLCVFMLMVAEAMPQTSDALPLIGSLFIRQIIIIILFLAVYFTCIMFEVGASVIFTVVALNYHHRMPETHLPMGSFLKHLLLVWLPKMLCMERPYPIKITIPNDVKIPTELKKRKGNKNNKLKDISNEILSETKNYDDIEKNFFFNPLNIIGKCNDSSYHLQNCIIANGSNKKNIINKSVKLDYVFKDNMNNFYNIPSTNINGERLASCSLNSIENFKLKNNDNMSQLDVIGNPKNDILNSKVTLEDVIEKLSKNNNDNYKVLIDHLSVITSKIQKEESLLEIRSDWIFAAMVIDRLCFLSFSLFMITCTGVLIYQAPHLFT